MKSLKYWASALAMDVLIFAGCYLWIAQDIERVGALVVFAGWFFAMLKLWIGLLVKEEYRSKRPTGFKLYSVIVDIAFVGVCVWQGHIWLAGFFAVGAMLYEARGK